MNAQPSLFEQPAARWTDPTPSHEAAWSLIPGNEDLVRRIRETVRVYGPMSAFDIADHVDRQQPGRWLEGTIRSAVSRANLGESPIKGYSPRGNRCTMYVLRTENTRPL